MPLPITMHSWPSLQQVEPVYPDPPHCSHASTASPEHSPVGGGTVVTGEAVATVAGAGVPATGAGVAIVTGDAVAAAWGDGVAVLGITGAGVELAAGADVSALTGEVVAAATGAGVGVASSPAGGSSTREVFGGGGGVG